MTTDLLAAAAAGGLVGVPRCRGGRASRASGARGDRSSGGGGSRGRFACCRSLKMCSRSTCTARCILEFTLPGAVQGSFLHSFRRGCASKRPPLSPLGPTSLRAATVSYHRHPYGVSSVPANQVVASSHRGCGTHLSPPISQTLPQLSMNPAMSRGRRRCALASVSPRLCPPSITPTVALQSDIIAPDTNYGFIIT